MLAKEKKKEKKKDEKKEKKDKNDSGACCDTCRMKHKNGHSNKTIHYACGLAEPGTNCAGGCECCKKPGPCGCCGGTTKTDASIHNTFVLPSCNCL